jgi:hypothetical protein
VKKANLKFEAIVKQRLQITPEELEEALAVLKAARQQAGHNESVEIEVWPGICLFYDPKVLPGDLEKRTGVPASMPMPLAQVQELVREDEATA